MEKVDVNEHPCGEWDKESEEVVAEWGEDDRTGGIPGFLPSWQRAVPEWGAPVPDVSALRTMAGGWIMADSDGMLASCNQLCPYVDAMLVYFRCEESVPERERTGYARSHARCLQVNCEYRNLRKLLFDPGRTLSYSLWPEDDLKFDRDSSDSPAYMGAFPLPDPGEKLRILAGWQPGHYDGAKLSRMRFLLFGRSTSWISIPVGRLVRVATLAVDEDRRVSFNGIRVRMRGNFDVVKSLKKGIK